MAGFQLEATAPALVAEHNAWAVGLICPGTGGARRPAEPLLPRAVARNSQRSEPGVVIFLTLKDSALYFAVSPPTLGAPSCDRTSDTWT